jgi:hypothetical protein
LKPETKFYAQVKKYFKEFSLIRLENLSLPGTPDLLVCNNNGHFFTIELKVTKTNKIKFSPHQIGFHVRHPHNTFILVLDASSKEPKLYEGSRIRELVACGLMLEPLCLGWDSCFRMLDACGLKHCK